jgi:hypothetical protein
MGDHKVFQIGLINKSTLGREIFFGAWREAERERERERKKDKRHFRHFNLTSIF